MSRHGLSDDYGDLAEDILAHGRWRGRVTSATRGKRGQAFLRALIDALEAMPIDKRELGASSFVASDGCMCALGAALNHSGKPQPEKPDWAIDEFDGEEDWAIDHAAHFLDIAESLAREVVWLNDEYDVPATPSTYAAWRTRTFGIEHPEQYVRRKRWSAVHSWAQSKLSH